MVNAGECIGDQFGRPKRRHEDDRRVRGTAAQTRQTQLVVDVHAFEGHIACDAASNSEIVVPLVKADGSLLGVWDVDSPLTGRFDDEDRAGMEALCAVFMRAIEAA